MRRFALALCASVVVLWTAPQAAAADDYLQVVVTNLKDANVYVAPGTPGTDGDTASELGSHLENGDHITLVMLPSDAAAKITDPVEFLHQVSSKTGNDDIIGLTIGDDAYAYSAVLPNGVASDLMKRAESVSTTGDETLYTFTRNVHSWETDHPHEVSTPNHADGSGFPWLIALLTLAALTAAAGVVVKRRLALASATDTVKFKRSPDTVKQYLERLLDLRTQVADYELQDTLLSCCRDVEAYFARYSSERTSDAVIFEDCLGRMVKVMEKYLDVQANGRYYNDPRAELQRGKTSASDFADYVLQCCKSGTTAQLAEYTVNTQILQAQRFR